MRRPTAFTMIELLIVVLVIAVLAAIVVPRYRNARMRAEVTRVISEMRVVRAAAFQVAGDSGTWPTDTPAGVVPPLLQASLGAAFPFARDRYSLDWDIVPFGSPPADYAALTVRSDDHDLIDALARQLGQGGSNLATAGSYTWIIDKVTNVPRGRGGGGGP